MFNGLDGPDWGDDDTFKRSCELDPRVNSSSQSGRVGGQNPQVEILQTAILTVCKSERTIWAPLCEGGISEPWINMPGKGCIVYF